MAKRRRGRSKTSPSETPTYTEAPKWRVLSTLVGLAVLGGNIHAAEGYILELLAHCAFADERGFDVA